MAEHRLSDEYPGHVYILVDKKPVVCEDLEAWRKWVEKLENRKVAHDFVGDVRIKTIFLGLDVSMKFLDEKPEFFETVILGGEFDSYRARTATWEDALDAHAGAVKLVRSGGVDDAGPG